jgi:hypothetical protein
VSEDMLVDTNDDNRAVNRAVNDDNNAWFLY